MKTIYILRHAKSDWDADYGQDHDRPLAKRGIRAAERLGNLVAGAGQVPDRAFSSTAVRARETVRIAAESGKWSTPIEHLGDLYGAGMATILEIAHALPDSVDSVLFVGHEPGWSTAVSALSGGGNVRMPTACWARIDFQTVNWKGCRPGYGTLTQLIPPKALD